MQNFTTAKTSITNKNICIKYSEQNVNGFCVQVVFKSKNKTKKMFSIEAMIQVCGQNIHTRENANRKQIYQKNIFILLHCSKTEMMLTTFYYGL